MNAPKTKAAPFTPIAFIRLGALVSGIPKIISQAENKTDTTGQPFNETFVDTFQSHKHAVSLRKGARFALRRFEELGIKTHIFTCLPSSKVVAPVLDHINHLVPKDGVANRFAPSDFIFSGEQRSIHVGYRRLVQEIQIINANRDENRMGAPVIALVFGYEHPDALFSIEASQILQNRKTPIIVLPFIHARRSYKSPEAAPSIHLDRTMMPLNPKELVIKSQCLKRNSPIPYSTSEKYFESRDLPFLTETAIQMAGTIGRRNSFDSFPCN